MVFEDDEGFVFLDFDYSVWREAIQLSASGRREVDVVCFPRVRRASLGTGNMHPSFCPPSLFVLLLS